MELGGEYYTQRLRDSIHDLRASKWLTASFGSASTAMGLVALERFVETDSVNGVVATSASIGAALLTYLSCKDIAELRDDVVLLQ